MGTNNTIVIISNKSNFINNVSSKLVLLRDLDKVVDTNSINAIPFLRENQPNVILVHCEQNDKNRIALIKEIKKESMLKNAPILLVGDMLSRETVLDAFDAGISDFIDMPILEHELLMRVIWCIKRNEINTNMESQKKFLSTLGIIQEETGFYTSLHGDDFLINEVDYAIKYRLNACVMFLAPEDRIKMKEREFFDIVKNSVRLNDSVVLTKDARFYIFLPKTKLNGVYAIFERMNENLNENGGVCASVVEIYEKSFIEIRESLERGLLKACENKKALIVASDDYSDSPVQETIKLTKETVLRSGNWVETPDYNEEEEICTEGEQRERLFKQAYKKKCKLVVEPVFKKYISNISEHYPHVDVERAIEQNHCKIVLNMKGVVSSFYINHSGGPKVKMDIQHVLNGEVKNSSNFGVELNDLGFQKLSQLLDSFFGDFSNLVNSVN